MKLRPYQQEAVDEILGSLMFGSKETILEAPTSYGKSIVISEVAKQLVSDGKKIAIVVSFMPLIDQISDTMDKIGLPYSILKAGYEDRFNEEEPIQLVMAQTLYARLEKTNISCEVMLVDEYHISYDTKRMTEIKNKLEPKAIVGFSATPYNSNGMTLSENAEIITTQTVKQLTNSGFLCPLRYYIPKWSERLDYSKVKTTGADYTLSSLDEIIGTPEHIEMAIESMNQLNAKDKKTIIFCSTIEQCDSIALALKEDGFQAEAYHSKRTKVDNENNMISFRENRDVVVEYEIEKDNLFDDNIKRMDIWKCKCLVSVSKVSIGFSVEDIQLGVLMRPTKALSLVRQSIGRVIRIHETKEYAEILDLSQSVSRFGFHDDIYEPIPYSDDFNVIKEAKAKKLDEMGLENLEVHLENDLVEFDLDKYKIRLEILKAKEDAVFTSSPTDYTPKEVADILLTTKDIKTMVWSGSVLWTLKNGQPISKKGRPYDLDAIWLSDGIEDKMDIYPEQKARWVQAYRTRVRNIIKKDGSNFNAVKFFIDFLIEKHLEDSIDIYEQFKKPYSINDYEIDMDEIPF